MSLRSQLLSAASMTDDEIKALASGTEPPAPTTAGEPTPVPEPEPEELPEDLDPVTTAEPDIPAPAVAESVDTSGDSTLSQADLSSLFTPPAPTPPAPTNEAPVPSSADFTPTNKASTSLKDNLANVAGKISRKQLLSAVAAVVVLALVAVVWSTAGSGNQEQAAPPPPSRAVSPDAPEVPGTGGGATGTAPAELTVATASALCGEGESTKASTAFSHDATDAWVCPRAHGIDGAIMNITFKNVVNVSEIRFTPGFNHVQNDTDLWYTKRVITRVLWRIGGQQIVQEVVPSREPAVLTLDTPITTKAASMTILASVPANESVGSDMVAAQGALADDATAVQELVFLGTERK